ncbi:hypothetical protein L210DRAFT_936256 [Boletus edulis BED1]|uniref:Uncharacterized protein n=1 Tax=Boletus edulis BED1 TaxID=1328754 RepID=A0AAD4BLF1_BOLED|nr:hypothetical protein L210DRAFT_936256 [Boletus edulis BED1]
MSRRLTPYLLAGLLGVVSGVYIFRPLFEENTAMAEIHSTTGTARSTERPQSDTAPQEGK